MLLNKVGENAVPIIALALCKVLWQKIGVGAALFCLEIVKRESPGGNGWYLLPCHASPLYYLRQLWLFGDKEEFGKKRAHISASIQKEIRKLNFKLVQ